jgi:superfamily II DNA helicase RecQ
MPCWLLRCRLGHLLCNVLRPRAVLALTATATPVTRACIRQLLAIPPEQQLIESPLRSNLRLGVAHFNGASKGGGIAAKVVQLLTTGEPDGLHACAVGCTCSSDEPHITVS